MSQKKVLVVEDDAVTAIELENRLDSWGFKVLTVTSGELAIKKAVDLNPDLILMDIMLEGDLDGIEAAGDIKNKIDTPIIFLTAYGDTQTLERAKITAPYGYILKPFDARELRFAVDMALYKYEMEKNLRDSESRYRALAESAQDMILTCDDQLTLQYINPYGAEFLHQDPQKLCGKKTTEIFPLDAAQYFESSFNHVLETKKPLEGEQFISNPEGGTWINYKTVPIFNPNDELEQFIIIARDISERKNMEEDLKTALGEKELLLKEIHHRVKNNLLIISSLLEIQSRRIDDEKAVEAFKESQNRAKSMALIHKRLYQSENLQKIDLPDYFNALTKGLIQSYSVSPKIKMQMDLEDIYLDVDTTVPLGLIMNELVSNSLKHAFSDVEKGKINISLHKKPKGRVELIIADNGCGLPPDMDFQQTESLGLQLVTSLVKQVKGNIKLDNKKGAKFIIDFQEKEYDSPK